MNFLYEVWLRFERIGGFDIGPGGGLQTESCKSPLEVLRSHGALVFSREGFFSFSVAWRKNFSLTVYLGI